MLKSRIDFVTAESQSTLGPARAAEEGSVTVEVSAAPVPEPATSPDVNSSFFGTKSPAVYFTLWFILNVVITLYSKAVFSVHHFPYPIMMTAIHLFFTSLGVSLSQLFGLYTPVAPTSEQLKTILWFSVIFTINIWLSNASLLAVSINLHQVLRTTIPLFTMLISFTFFNQSYSLTLLPSIILVIAGVAASVWGDMDFDAFGIAIVFAGCSFSSMKGLLTQRTQVGGQGMTSLDLLRYMAPLAVVQLLILSAAMGELSRLRHDDNLSYPLFKHLFYLGWVAFGVNFVSFRSAALNHPLTLNIGGNVKQVLTSLLSIWIFGGTLSTALAFGILITAVGAFWYSFEMQRCKNAAKKEKARAETFSENVELTSLKVDDPDDTEIMVDDKTGEARPSTKSTTADSSDLSPMTRKGSLLDSKTR